MEKRVGPAFRTDTGYSVTGYPVGSRALAAGSIRLITARGGDAKARRGPSRRYRAKRPARSGQNYASAAETVSSVL